MSQNKIEILNDVQKQALKLGADECDVILSSGKSLSLSAYENKIDKYQVSSSQIVGLRVIKDKKIGLSSSESLEKESLETMCAQALDNAKYSSPAEFQSIKSEFSRSKELSSEANYKSDETAIDKKIDFALALESEVKALDKDAQIPYTGYGEDESETYYLNSEGVTTYRKENDFHGYTSSLLKSENDNATHFKLALGNRFSQLNAKALAEQSYKTAKMLLGATPCKTGKYNVVFDPNNMASLYGVFHGLLSAQSAMEGKNRFRDQLGTQVASKLLTIMDLPHYEDALHQQDFDDEGYSMDDVTMISEGVLNSFLHSSETANYFKVSHNGRSSRGPKSSLRVASTNTVIMPGNETNIYNGKVLKIIGLDGLHSGANPISGDFSFGARGILLNNGQEEQVVKGITVSGNFFELIKQIEAVGTKAFSNDYRTFFAPEILFGNVDIAGT
jgi:PmbA protein